ncbi:hypothetical protein [Streptomyces sp. NPDC004065]|uniref:hypothetical protein n=1 Tax=Streptomyces sp. NPDC004065 TaxID=3364689 RepID=UPI003850B1D3
MPATPQNGADPITGLLATAESLLTESPSDGPLTPTGRARGAAYALRIALETAVDAVLTVEEDAFREVRSMRAKLLCLRHYAGPGLARRVHALWSRLSSGCKYHRDEIGPSHTQVRDWQTAVEGILAELAASRTGSVFPWHTGAERAGEDRARPVDGV